MTVNQRDIAELLGISKVTVSRALNDSPLVADDMKRKVKELCERLEYYPHFGSRALHSRLVNAISVIRYSVHLTDVHSRWIYKLQLEAQSRGYMLRLDSIENFGRIVAEHSADGFIVFDYTTAYDEKYPKLKQTYEEGSIPMIIIDCESTGTGSDRVSVDNYGAVVDLVRHLHGLGHKEIAFIGTDSHGVGIERHLSYLDQIAALGLGYRTEYSILAPDWAGSIEETHELLDRLRTAVGAGATAFIGGSDIFAVGAIKMLRKMGLRVPEDISVTGFDDSLLSQAFEPSLTTVYQKIEDVSILAVDMLIRRIETGEHLPGEKVGTELILRETTGPAPK